MNFKIENKPQEILKTNTFFVNREMLLRSHPHPNDFLEYEIEPGKLALRGEMWMGAVGLEGELGLLIPPAKRNIDEIGYSIQWGQYDWWRFLSFITIPRGKFSVAISFSFSHETFFDLSQDVVCCIESEKLGTDERQICTHFSPDTTPVSDAWHALWKVLQREFSAHVAGAEYQDL